jgi:hypothetical protein
MKNQKLLHEVFDILYLKFINKIMAHVLFVMLAKGEMYCSPTPLLISLVAAMHMVGQENGVAGNGCYQRFVELATSQLDYM